MANEQNLKPFTSEQSREEAAKNGKKGGKASGQARREKKMLKDTLEFMLSLPLKNEELKEKIKKMGIEVKNIDYQTAITIALLNQATKGNIRAYKTIRDTLGEIPTQNPKSQTSFVDEMENAWKERENENE